MPLGMGFRRRRLPVSSDAYEAAELSSPPTFAPSPTLAAGAGHGVLEPRLVRRLSEADPGTAGSAAAGNGSGSGAIPLAALRGAAGTGSGGGGPLRRNTTARPGLRHQSHAP